MKGWQEASRKLISYQSTGKGEDEEEKLDKLKFVQFVIHWHAGTQLRYIISLTGLLRNAGYCIDIYCPSYYSIFSLGRGWGTKCSQNPGIAKIGLTPPTP